MTVRSIMEAIRYDIPPVPLREIAEGINARGLTAPAIFFLEMQKPLATVTGALYSVAEPFAQFLFGAEFARSAGQILSSRETAEELIRMLEEIG